MTTVTGRGVGGINNEEGLRCDTSSGAVIYRCTGR